MLFVDLLVSVECLYHKLDVEPNDVREAFALSFTLGFLSEPRHRELQQEGHQEAVPRRHTPLSFNSVSSRKQLQVTYVT